MSTYKQRRINLVLKVLGQNPRARSNGKDLLIDVWKEELDGRPFTPDNIKQFCSAPSGVDRDRRRPEVLNIYPRGERKYRDFRSYTNEFSTKQSLTKVTQGRIL